MINLTHKPTIEGEKIRMRPFIKADLAKLEEILTDQEVIILTGSDDAFDREIVSEWYQTRNKQPNRLDLAIEDKETHQIVGEVVLNEYDGVGHQMNFRILIGENGRNRGLGSESIQLFCDYVFKHTDLSALTLSVFAFNPRAIHVYEKVGFEVASIDEKEIEYQGEWIDSLNMRLTREKFLK